MSPISLRILQLEDNPLDAELQLELLSAEGFATESVRVDTRADLLAALEEDHFDLIFADNSMPGFDGLSALKLVRELEPNLPFIFVSGTLGEENHLLGAALSAERSGDRDRARVLFEALIAQNPGSPLAPEARMGLSRVH